VQIGKSRTSEELWRFKEAEIKYSRGLRRLTNGRNSVPKSQGNLFENKDLKGHKIGEFEPRKEMPCT